MTNIRETAKVVLYPFRYVRYIIKLVMAYLRDLNRYQRYTKIDVLNSSQERMRAAILMSYHGFEKGLSLAEPRVGFGQPKIPWLLVLVRQYVKRFGKDSTSQVALELLWAYYKWNLEHGKELTALYKSLLELSPEGENVEVLKGGVVETSRKEILNHAKIDLESFFETRHSIRSFGNEVVEMSVVEQAVRMAQNTPSVCNRQPWRVYAFSGEEKNRVISCQSGNKGFGHLADKVLIVTCELQSFFGEIERNEYGIDGGMFSMTLVYALHSLGLGTCCLAWTVEQKLDLQLRQIARIKKSETVIMLIAVGHLPKSFQVARATRMELSQVFSNRASD